MARYDLRLSDVEFLLISPAALEALLDRAAENDRKQIFSAAMVCASYHNVHNNWDTNPAGWRPQDFMPGAKPRVDQDAEDMKEFVLAAERGELEQDSDPELAKQFTASLQAYFHPKVPNATRR